MKSLWGVIARWYRAHGRNLPWRNTVDPYRVVVSEFMLQQTQVDRVVPLFTRFVSVFPSWNALAEASQADVVRAWKGLGYNMRAVRLRHLAMEVVTRYDGMLPSETEALVSLKGIGPYTARAIRAFVFRKRALAPDTNLRRVLNRVYKGPKADPKMFDERSWLAWERSLPERLSYDVNQGLMDIGATLCKARSPSCEVCPLKKLCKSYPRILKMKSLPKQKASRVEKTDALGIPNRIYRGRVIEELRARSVSHVHLEALGRRVRVGFEKKDLPWLQRVLEGLEKDGLIKKSRDRWVLA
ncbi:MAG: A/G-specific adenine glycosylase [Patescibacteria group bacterium]|jgi:A/G-specific adenine glycosylase